jgi:hypothetical protein
MAPVKAHGPWRSRLVLLLLLSMVLCPRVEAGLPQEKYKHLPDFQVPKEFSTVQSFHPIVYLESYPVSDPGARLSSTQKERLARLVIAAARSCRKKYQQDYLIRRDSPIMKLLEHNVPEVAVLPEVEDGSIQFLEPIGRALTPVVARPVSRPSATASKGARLTDKSALHAAVRRVDAATVGRLLKHGATDIDALDDEHGQSSLHWAVIGGCQPIAKLLLDAGADPNVEARDGRTPLWHADDFGLTAIADLLRSRGAR